MTDAELSYFRRIAEAMNDHPTDWQWIGPYISQRLFGITEARARDYARRFGGRAQQMEPRSARPRR
jgi:hypothetical protein